MTEKEMLEKAKARIVSINMAPSHLIQSRIALTLNVQMKTVIYHVTAAIHNNLAIFKIAKFINMGWKQFETSLWRLAPSSRKLILA